MHLINNSGQAVSKSIFICTALEIKRRDIGQQGTRELSEDHQA
jgi:hypothetical protein